MSRAKALALPVLAAVALAGCADNKVLREASIDYKSPENQQHNPLAIPPDLISSTEQQAVSDSYSRYLIGSLPERGSVVPAFSEVRYAREGDTRWVEVELPPNEVWPVVEDFWEDLGFALIISDPATGIMETNWLQNRSKLLGTGLTGVFDEFLGRLQDTGERDKYRTRIERGSREGTTEVYVTHRGVQEQLGRAGYEFERIPNDASLEAEILRRIMLRFAADPESATAQADEAEREQEQELRYGDDWLLIDDALPQAWRRTAIALDRSGFTVAERRREESYFLIRYSDERVETGDEGLFSGIVSVFSGDTAIPAANIRIALEPAGEEETRLSVRSDDDPGVEEVAPDIIALISENI